MISRGFAKPPLQIQDGKEIGKPYKNGNLWQT
jgi:hypothetical protein